MEQQQQKCPTHKAILSRLSLKSIPQDCLHNEVVEGFEQATILSRYHQLQKEHFEQLATINMNDTLKRKLFGFSSVAFLTNPFDPNSLIIENHPMNGRTLMSQDRFSQRQMDRLRQAKIFGAEGTITLSNKVNSCNNFSDGSKKNNSYDRLLDEGNENSGGEGIELSETRLIADIPT